MELTDEDKALVIKQCQFQNATSDTQLNGFASAYATAKHMVTEDLPILVRSASYQGSLELVWLLGKLVETEVNSNGWRTVPVTAGNNMMLDHKLIDNAMTQWLTEFTDNMLYGLYGGAHETYMYTQFENIHPFLDGNGRVGHLLWAMLVTRRTGMWPLMLPPDVFELGHV